MGEAPEAIVVPPGGGTFFGNVEFLARSEDTSRFNLGIITLDPNSDGPPAHAHKEEDDSFFVLSGELEMEASGKSFVATPGTFVLVSPGVRHTFRNSSSEETRFLNIHAPAGFDHRLMEPDD